LPGPAAARGLARSEGVQAARGSAPRRQGGTAPSRHLPPRRARGRVGACELRVRPPAARERGRPPRERLPPDRARGPTAVPNRPWQEQTASGDARHRRRRWPGSV